MARVSLAEYMKELRTEPRQPGGIGPFITISRQYGCYGFSLGMLLLEVLNEEIADDRPWKVYSREILEKLATESNLATEFIERERHTEPRLVVDFFRALSPERIPSGYEIRNRITTIIRGIAIRGRAVIIGQGGAGATEDFPNGLSVRLEAPEEWRVKQVAFRMGVSLEEARKEVLAREEERQFLRKLYEKHFPHRPTFDLTYDATAFTLAQIAQHVVCAMRLKGLI